MRAIEVLLLVVLLVSAGSWAFFKVWMVSRMRTIYFSGGLLDGQHRKVKGKSTSLLTHGDEIYRSEDDGVYVYQGDVDDSSVVKYRDI